MATVEALIATTHVDRHFERLALSALEGMRDQALASYIPVMVNHDPRYPPIGRTSSAEIIRLADGEYGLRATWELFEPGIDQPGDGRRMVLESDTQDGWEVGFDRTVAANDPDRDVDFLQGLSGRRARERGKKALAPIAELVILAGTFVAGSIATGFFGAIGADAWHQLKDRLGKRYSVPREELFEVELGVGSPSEPVQVLILVEDPSSDAVRGLFDSQFADVDELVEYATSREADLAKVVLVWRDSRLRLAYAVRTDAYPVLVDRSLIPPELPPDFELPSKE